MTETYLAQVVLGRSSGSLSLQLLLLLLLLPGWWWGE
jgi:hypothetical protein